MSWLDQVQNNLQIITGDGKEYIPNWLNASKLKEYNIAEFNFPLVPGTLVPRGTPRGNKYNLEIYFQGEDHLDIAEAFDKSADDPRPWNLRHPFYGVILVQPVSLSQDNSAYNVSKFTIPIIETIDQANPRIVVDPISKILDISALALGNMQVSFGLALPTTFDIPDMLTDLQSVYDQGAKRVKLTADASNYFNSFREAYAAVSNVVGEAQEAIFLIQTVINAPALFIDSVQNRINMLESQFTTLVDSIDSVVSVFDKKRHEQFSGAIICAMCEASVTDIDYRNRSQVIQVMDKLVDSYNIYISNLDSFQTDNGGSPDSYIPDQASIMEISRLVSFTVSNLFYIAISTKQERIIYLDKDTNLIEIAHRLYGLLPDDSTIQTIINDNNIGINELLQIKKGRAITYTV